MPADEWNDEVVLNDAVIVLDAFPQEQLNTVLASLNTDSRFVLLANVDGLDQSTLTLLSSTFSEQQVLPPTKAGKKVRKVQQVYTKGWWKSGSKQLCQLKSGGLYVWSSLGTPNFDTPVGTIPVELDGQMDPLVEQYLDATPSGPYRDMAEQVCWTDGSKIKVKDGPEMVRAGGWTRTGKHFSFRVGGEAAVVHGEMAAITWALHPGTHDRHRTLAIMSDSKSTLDIINRWLRGDFAPRPDDELHWDILSSLLDNLRQRTALTTFVWVKAHAGDPGNEMADYYAGLGTVAEELEWHRNTTPIELYSWETDEKISHAGWSPTAQKFATTFVGQVKRELLANVNQVISTTSLIKEDRG